MKTAIGCLSLALVLAVPADAEAQRRSNAYRYNAYSFSPYVGVLMDAYDAEADGSNLGWIAGFRAGYRESPRANFHLNFGYGQTGDVATRPIVGEGTVYDNQWIMLTAGGDFALVPGNTSISLGTDLGVAWRRTRPVGGASGGAESSGWTAHDVVAPGLIIRHQFTPRAGIFGSAQDYILDLLEGDVQHSPAFTVGLTIR